MFHLVKVNDVVRIPPAKFKDDLKETISEVVTDENVGKITPEYGVVLGVVNIDEVGDASVVLGDGAAFVNACYDVLVFKPASQNVYEGEVKDIAEFGAFMGLGPFDGLVHVSQIMDDFISYDPKNMCFVGKETNRTLSKDDTIMAKLVSVSMKGNVTQSKLGLTMRQEGLGKTVWSEKEEVVEMTKPKKKDKKAEEKIEKETEKKVEAKAEEKVEKKVEAKVEKKPKEKKTKEKVEKKVEEKTEKKKEKKTEDKK